MGGNTEKEGERGSGRISARGEHLVDWKLQFRSKERKRILLRSQRGAEGRKSSVEV